MQRKEDEPPAVTRRCPICGKSARLAELPFCSRRCAEIDLHRWLSEAYRVPGAPAPPEEGEGAQQKPRQK